MSFSRSLTRRAFAAIMTAAVPAVSVLRAFAQSASPDSMPTGGTRIFTDAMGEVEIPANPQRIVVLDGPMLDAALSVGVTPIGATTGFADDPFPAYLGDRTEGIANVGIITEPNLEAIIELEPDLIIGTKVRHESIHPVLIEIAPTVFSETVGATWQNDFLLFTDAMNKKTEGENVIAQYRERIDAFKQATDGDRQDWRISIVRFLPGAVRLYYHKSFIGTILDDLEMPRAESQDSEDPVNWSEEISEEQIRLCDGTHIFACAWGATGDTPLEAYDANPLWHSLDAVKNDRLYWVDDEYWMVGIGYIAANKVMDDLEAFLIDGVAPTPVPVAS
ncbi:MAG TPA: iron-siderophore ABC transporter substrate-binding protein [Thermomicrobiales bacterium]|nr:iron-siderophore ABC transporter substrate-binding protein [Thermomicrobiales bacterium]